MTSNLRSVITGGASGLGRAFALEVARRGGPVIVADIDRSGAEETVRQVESLGVQAHAVECDVGDRDAVGALAFRAEELLGGVDLLANNAGVAVAGALEDIPIADWRWIVDINLWGVIYGCEAFYPAMKQRGRGYIINVASMAGLLCAPFMAPYNVTKAGVIALSETLHAEARNHGVHVSALCPTFFVTKISEAGRSQMGDEVKAWIEKSMKRSRVQAPDVARTAIEAVLAGQLYALPMRDGRVLWRIKRALPHSLYSFVVNRFASRLPRAKS